MSQRSEHEPEVMKRNRRKFLQLATLGGGVSLLAARGARSEYHRRAAPELPGFPPHGPWMTSSVTCRVAGFGTSTITSF